MTGTERLFIGCFPCGSRHSPMCKSWLAKTHFNTVQLRPFMIHVCLWSGP